MPIDFNNIFNTLKQGISSLAVTSLKDFANEAAADGQALLDSVKGNLIKWTSDLANGSMSQADFKDLLLGQKDLIKMVALKQKGLTLMEADKFKSAVFDLITNTIFAAI